MRDRSDTAKQEVSRVQMAAHSHDVVLGDDLHSSPTKDMAPTTRSAGRRGEESDDDNETVINQIMTVFDPYGCLSPHELAQVDANSNHARYVDQA